MKIMASSPITPWEIGGETVKTVSDLIFWGSKITADGDCSHEIKRLLLLGRKVMTNVDSIFKSRDITLPTKVCLVKAMVLPVVMYGCEMDCEESWVPKNWCFWTLVLEKILESPLDCKEIQPVYSKGYQSWVFIGRTGAEAETPILWPHHAWKRPWCWEELRAEGEGDDRRWDGWWHHWLDACEFGWTPGVGDGQGDLACCDSWGRKESDTTERLNWTELKLGSDLHKSICECFVCLFVFSPVPLS